MSTIFLHVPILLASKIALYSKLGLLWALAALILLGVVAVAVSMMVIAHRHKPSLSKLLGEAHWETWGLWFDRNLSAEEDAILTKWMMAHLNDFTPQVPTPIITPKGFTMGTIIPAQRDEKWD